MKQYTYTGTELIAFSFQKKDYIVFEEGPHELPSGCKLIKNLTNQGLLVEIITKKGSNSKK